MQPTVLRSRHYLKIAQTIIDTHTILVVDQFGTEQITTEFTLHDRTVLKHITRNICERVLRHQYLHVSVAIQMTTSTLAKMSS